MLCILAQIQELLTLQVVLVNLVVGMGKSSSSLGWQNGCGSLICLWRARLAAAVVGWEGSAWGGHWLLLPRQPCAAGAGAKCAQTSQCSRSTSSGGPLSPALCHSTACLFPVPREPKRTPKVFRSSEPVLQPSAFAWSRLLNLILQAFLLYCL